MQWLIPEFRECWWDSLFLDFILSNMIGMVMGVVVLRWLNSRSYDWIGREEGRYKQALVRFLPFTWSEYHWGFFRSRNRLFQAMVMLVLSNLAELNSFFIMYALGIPVIHYYHLVRLICLTALAMPSVAEHYEYVSSTSWKRVGHNFWLFVNIVVIECLVCLKYGKSRFARLTPPMEVLVPWIVSITIFTVLTFCHFYVIDSRVNVVDNEAVFLTTEKVNLSTRRRIPQRSPVTTNNEDLKSSKVSYLESVIRILAKVSPMYAFLPLLYLAKFYDYT